VNKAVIMLDYLFSFKQSTILVNVDALVKINKRCITPITWNEKNKFIAGENLKF